MFGIKKENASARVVSARGNNKENLGDRKNKLKWVNDNEFENKDIVESVVLLEDNVFECNKCEGKYCTNAFIRWYINVEKVTCNPGELCWVSLQIINDIP